MQIILNGFYIQNLQSLMLGHCQGSSWVITTCFRLSLIMNKDRMRNPRSDKSLGEYVLTLENLLLFVNQSQFGISILVNQLVELSAAGEFS